MSAASARPSGPWCCCRVDPNAVVSEQASLGAEQRDLATINNFWGAVGIAPEGTRPVDMFAVNSLELPPFAGCGANPDSAPFGCGRMLVDGAQVAGLLSGLEGFPDAEVTLDEPNVRLDTVFDVFGLEIPVAVSLTPSAEEGAIVLAPAGIEVAGAELTADQVRNQFGLIASAVLQDWTICVAEYLPAGVALEEIAVVGDRIVADAAVDGAIISDASLQEPGTCS